MPTPSKGYYNKSGIRVPGTTTIIKSSQSAEGLVYWAWNIAYAPYRETRAMLEKIVQQGAVDSGTLHDCKTILAKPDPDFRAKRDNAANVGTIVHARIDAWTRNMQFDAKPYESPEIPDPAAASQIGFNAFLEWAGATKFKLVEAEMQLVSEEYNYGGTPDVMMVREKTTVGDYKTGDLRPTSLLPQLAAYQHLLREHGHKIEDNGAHAMSINRETGGFIHRYFTPEEVARGWNVFTTMLKLHQLMKEMK